MIRALIRGLALGQLLARVFYRKFELRRLCRAAQARPEALEELVNQIGFAIQDRTPLLTAIEQFTLSGMGHDINAAGKRGAICWNAPIGIRVYLAERPYFGLGLEFRGSALCIRQMQGVPGAKPLECLRDWPELLVRVCMACAHELGFAEVRIYKADQDFNYRSPDLEPGPGQSYAEAAKIHQDRMRRRYDRTAQKLKFAKKKRYYVWYPPEAQPH